MGGAPVGGRVVLGVLSALVCKHFNPDGNKTPTRGPEDLGHSFPGTHPTIGWDSFVCQTHSLLKHQSPKTLKGVLYNPPTPTYLFTVCVAARGGAGGLPEVGRGSGGWLKHPKAF